MNTVSPAPARRRALTAAGIATGLALVVATPLMASAHVHVDPGEVTAGSSQTLTFSFSHGCEGSPTTALVLDMPDEVTTVTPVLDGAWSISRELGSDGIPTQVTYTALHAVEDGLKANVSMAVTFEEAAANTAVAFPITQACETGENAWVEVAEEGEDADSLESPAPVVSVGEFSEDDGHHAAATDTEEATDDAHADGESDHADAEASTDAAVTADDSSNTAALWLGAGGLAAGLAALVLVLIRTRSTKS
ncbi:DUF1775 domain-containing protein (plasmid) [Coraliomargarita sp. W4R53]